MAFLSLSAAVPHMKPAGSASSRWSKSRATRRCRIFRPSARPCRVSRCPRGSACSPRRNAARGRHQLNEGVAKVLKAEGVKAKLGALGLVVAPAKPEDLGRREGRHQGARGTDQGRRNSARMRSYAFRREIGVEEWIVSSAQCRACGPSTSLTLTPLLLPQRFEAAAERLRLFG